MPAAPLPLDRPFLRSEAGLSDRLLRNEHKRVFRGVYVHKSVTVDAKIKAQAAWLATGRNCVLSGYSAAALLGVKWIPDEAPAHVTCKREIAITGIEAFRDSLQPQEVTGFGEIRVTDAIRSAFDLGRRLPLDDAVVMLDAVYQGTSVRPEWVAKLAARHPGARGLRQLEKALALSDRGAESPWETRTRLVIVRAGLPRPVSQHCVRAAGKLVARVDLAWPQWLVAVEYDGAHHFTDVKQARRDVDRWNGLVALGWVVVRVTRRQLDDGAEAFVEQLRAVLPGDL